MELPTLRYFLGAAQEENITRAADSNMFVYKILEDFSGNLWLATYSNGVFRYDVNKKEWKNFIFHKNGTFISNSFNIIFWENL